MNATFYNPNHSTKPSLAKCAVFATIAALIGAVVVLSAMNIPAYLLTLAASLAAAALSLISIKQTRVLGATLFAFNALLLAAMIFPLLLP